MSDKQLKSNTQVCEEENYNYQAGKELPQAFQCGGVANAGKYMRVDIDGYIRPLGGGGGGEGGYEPDFITINLTSNNTLGVIDYISATTVNELLQNYCLEEFAVELDERLHDLELNTIPNIQGDITQVKSDIAQIESELSVLTPKVERALLIPIATPTSVELVGIGSDKEQKRVKIGDGLSYDTTTDTLSASGITPTNYVSLDTDQQISGHKNFNGNVEVNYSGTNAHYGANTLIRNTTDNDYTLTYPDKNGTFAVISGGLLNVFYSQGNTDYGVNGITRHYGGSNYNYNFPEGNGTLATQEYVNARVQSKYIHKVEITGMEEVEGFGSNSKITMIFITKGSNAIEDWNSIIANIGLNHIIDGQIYDTSSYNYAKYDLGHAINEPMKFIKLGSPNVEVVYNSAQFTSATFTDTIREF